MRASACLVLFCLELVGESLGSPANLADLPREGSIWGITELTSYGTDLDGGSFKAVDERLDSTIVNVSCHI